jgi:hypothetical protein
MDMTSHSRPTITRTVPGDSVVARAQRRARAAAIHRGPTVGIHYDAAAGTYRLAVAQTI